MPDPSSPTALRPNESNQHLASTVAVEADSLPILSQTGGLRGILVRFGGPLVFVVSLVAAGIVLWLQGELDDVGSAIRGADLPIVVAGIALYTFGLGLLCLRWHVLVRMTKGESDLARAAEAILLAITLSYVVQKVLAVPMRAALTKKSLGLNKTETAAVVLWDLLADVGVLGIGSVLWLLVNADAFDELRNAAGSRLLLIGGVLLVLVLLAAGAFAVASRRPALRTKILNSVNQALRYPRQRPREARRAIALSVVFWTIQLGVFGLLLDGIGGEVSIGLLLGIVTIPILIGMVSPFPGGAGVREALMVAVAGAYGAASAPVLVAAVLYRIALFISIPILYVAARIWISFRGDQAVSIRPEV